MIGSVDLVALLADPNTFAIRHDWEDVIDLDETADEYYDISQASTFWTREKFREHLRRAPLKEKLQIHEELNDEFSEKERLTEDDIEVLEKVYNTSGVSKRQFTKAILGLPLENVVELLVRAEGTIDRLMELMTRRYELEFPSCANIGHQDFQHILSHFRKITGCGSVVDAFVTACSSELAEVWFMDALVKVFNRRLKNINSKAQYLHNVRSGRVEKRERRKSFKRKHRRQHLREKRWMANVVNEGSRMPSYSPSPEDLNAEDGTGVSKSNETHLPSPRSSPDHHSQTSEEQSRNCSPCEDQFPTSEMFTWSTDQTHGYAREAFEIAMKHASDFTDRMADLSNELGRACTQLEQSPTASHKVDDSVSRSPFRRAEREGAENETQRKQRTAKTDANNKIRANQETISKYFEDNKTSPEKTSTAKSPKSSRRVPAGTSCIDFPPLSAKKFGLIQEQLADNPFELLVAVCLLNKTKGAAALPAFFKLMEKHPTPKALTEAHPESILKIISHLGLQNNRTKTIVELAQRWVDGPPAKDHRFRTLDYPISFDGRNIGTTEVLGDGDSRRGAFEIGGFPGVGRYALDSWRIFCRDVLRGVATGYNGEGAGDGFEPEWKRVVPKDKELRAYLKWMWLREGWNWEPLEGKRTPVTAEYLEQVEHGGHEFGKTGIIGVEENVGEWESSQETLCGW